MVFFSLISFPSIHATPDEGVIDSYPITSAAGGQQEFFPSATGFLSAQGQVFTVLGGHDYKLTHTKFKLAKSGSPTGMIHSVLYEMTGTYGTTGKPTGEPLATSDDYDIETLGAEPGDWVTFTFSGDEQYVMEEGLHYAIACQNPTSGFISWNNFLCIADDPNTVAHDGNAFEYHDSGWYSYDYYDQSFYVYGEVVASPTPTPSSSPTPTSSPPIEFNVPIMFYLGILGVIGVIACPCLIIYKLKGYDDPMSKIKAASEWLIVWAVCIGLAIAWLWSV